MEETDVQIVYNKLIELDIKVVIALPDSISAGLCRFLQGKSDIKFIQPTHESDCVGISTGLALTNTRSIIIMENSGLRNACETIARFHLSHMLFTNYLISFRGDFGERNWWGHAHQTTMVPLLDLLRFRWTMPNNIEDLSTSLDKAFDDYEARQASTAIIIKKGVIK